MIIRFEPTLVTKAFMEPKTVCHLDHFNLFSGESHNRQLRP